MSDDDEDSMERPADLNLDGCAPLDPAAGSHLIYDSVAGCMIGRNPKGLRTRDMRRMGCEPVSVLRAIRNKCLDCANSEIEVRRCGMRTCPLWPFRMGSNPFRAEQSEEQRAAASARARANFGRPATESDGEEEDETV